MPLYDYRCTTCGVIHGDQLRRIEDRDHGPMCCGVPAGRVTLPTHRSVTSDDIPGGVWLENYGPDPVFVYSHTERRRIMKERGLREMVRHVGVPGTDKSPHTTDWQKGSIDAQTLRNAEALVLRPSTTSSDRDREIADQSFRDSDIREVNITATLPVNSGA